MSSAQVYGEPSYLPVDEHHSTIPKTNYGISKLAGELYLRAFGVKGRIKYTILRLFNVFGPGQKRGFVIPDLIAKIRNLNDGEPLVVYATRTTSRDFIFIDDVTAAIQKVVKLKPVNEVLNICSGQETQIIKLASELLRLMGKKNCQVILSDPVNPHSPQRLVGDCSKMQKYLGIKITDFAEALKTTVESYF